MIISLWNLIQKLIFQKESLTNQLLLGIFLINFLQSTPGWQLEPGRRVILNIPISNTGNDQRGTMTYDCNIQRQQVSHSSTSSSATNKTVCILLMNESALVY